MIDDDYSIEQHLESEGISEDIEGPKIAMTDGGQPLEDIDNEEGRLSRIRNNLSGKYNAAADAAPESPFAWLGASGVGAWIVNETEDEAWDSIAREMPEYIDSALKNTALAADYAADAGADAGAAAYNLGEAGAVAAVALGSIGAAGKAVQTYRRRNNEE